MNYQLVQYIASVLSHMVSCANNYCFFCRSVLGSVAEGGATSMPGSFSDIMQSPMSSVKQMPTDLTGTYHSLTTYSYMYTDTCTHSYTQTDMYTDTHRHLYIIIYNTSYDFQVQKLRLKNQKHLHRKTLRKMCVVIIFTAL